MEVAKYRPKTAQTETDEAEESVLIRKTISNMRRTQHLKKRKIQSVQCNLHK